MHLTLHLFRVGLGEAQERGINHPALQVIQVVALWANQRPATVPQLLQLVLQLPFAHLLGRHTQQQQQRPKLLQQLQLNLPLVLVLFRFLEVKNSQELLTLKTQSKVRRRKKTISILIITILEIEDLLLLLHHHLCC